MLKIGPGATARYLVREKFARVSFPSDAVGQTSGVSGSLVFDANGAVLPGLSIFTVDLSTLKSDEVERDDFLKKNSLETNRFPLTTLVVREAPGLPWPLPSGGELDFQLRTDMTVHGETVPMVWDVNARFGPGAVEGQAKTNFPFATFKMQRPRAFFLISVDDNIRLELDFSASIGPAS